VAGRRADPRQLLRTASFATFALAGQRNAVPVTGAAAELAPELLAPLGCGVQTGAGAVLNVLRPGAGDSLVVFGAGAVGLAAVMAAALLPLRYLIVVDVQTRGCSWRRGSARPTW